MPGETLTYRDENNDRQQRRDQPGVDGIDSHEVNNRVSAIDIRNEFIASR